jgi:fatty-acyl-CoA synthase
MGCVAAVGVWSPEQQTEMVCVVAETRSGAVLHGVLAERIRDVLKGHGISVDRVLLTLVCGMRSITGPA